MQTALDLTVMLPPSAYDYGERSSGEAHGVVLTKPHVVNLILDLAGYTADRDLASLSLLEPACGHGAFLVPAAERLISSARRHDRDLRDIESAIRAYDIEPDHVGRARLAVSGALARLGLPPDDARRLSDAWIAHGDFLLTSQGRRFDAVVGNPPYIRIEQLSPELQEEYRQRYRSLYDRADLYVAFIERGLDLLAPGGVLSFICADRWTLNRYGAPLRRMLSRWFRVQCYIDLHSASPFESDVVAYPSIFAVSRGKTGSVPVATLSTASPEECEAASSALRRAEGGAPERCAGVTLSEYPTWFDGEDPWVLSSPAHLEALRSLEARFAPIEEVGGTRVGIGVATGSDRIYIVRDDIDIERDRLVPLVLRDDIEDGRVRDAGRCVINTFGRDGKVVNLDEYPKLAAYLRAHEAEIRKRYIAQKNAASWFRTIDRVYPEVALARKLLVPDIAGSNEVVYEEGRFHPHHNLYFITSEGWDLEALGGLLSSRVALFFVWSYAVKMRGGYLRFQAQYLRRIRLPPPESVAEDVMSDLRSSFRQRDFERLDALALRAYGIDALPGFSFLDTRRRRAASPGRGVVRSRSHKAFAGEGRADDGREDRVR
ncbi:Eco57I restriction-modification methylase domain-containing protein [Sorangium cellulosum]|uniref:Eco57I restriction-modification methylase domain-containing protein n=1 Tax=Sorangium TaxID=39643 RepID=UPI0009D69A1D|nr:Eco57I restriction-modification methylase domain-containing protein [Sorangium cellulosum]